MVKFISSWAQEIVIAVIISTIIEMILPEGKIKKYVRTVIGVYIVFIIISPIMTKITGKKFNLDSYKLPETNITNTIDTNAYIESTYINTIKQEIIKSIEEKEYNIQNISLEIENDEVNYGKIKRIDLKISKKNKKNKNIEEIKIDINKSVKKTEDISTEEIQELKEFLEKNYGIKNIYINE